MININNIKNIKEVLNNELKENLNLIGTKEYSILCNLINDSIILIKRLENPGKARKIDKLIK